MLIVTTAGSSEASEKKTTEETAAATEETQGTAVNKLIINDAGAYAEEIYSLKVEDTHDTASVALLLETMGMKDVAGEYTVEIAPADDMKVLTVIAKPVVKAETKRAYDDNMEIIAQQLLALIPGVDQITWNYPVTSSDNKQETVSVSVDAEAASNEIGDDIRSFGDSQRAFEKLVKEQMR